LGVPFSRADLLAFVEDVWAVAEEDPDAVRWAERFVESMGSPMASKI
jgi:hypothetical protein